MMYICGLRVIVMSEVPPSLRYWRHLVVVEPEEAAALVTAAASQGCGDLSPITTLLEGHENWMRAKVSAEAIPS